MAAANVPTAMFLGFALVLGLGRRRPLPRRWRSARAGGVRGGLWHRRRCLHRVAPALALGSAPEARDLAPRCLGFRRRRKRWWRRCRVRLPKRAQVPDPSSDLAARIEHSHTTGPGPEWQRRRGRSDRVAEELAGDDGADEATPDDARRGRLNRSRATHPRGRTADHALRATEPHRP